ncbi:hypothetical protein AKJ44_00970 [candidate division MSBL1 archaeon SCGC-AAA261F17]|uniref:NurA domain-containing protein n=1 Tax=candidate division MSBL1 archaeon SCGC-AAA261F17 TaxID=1698274 RepID=A0A133V750_9EURY|nr:hypothetical protein AKJ44_00970 [candidate division MSBL1 archaeon SCGC-AAA261F17]
MISTMKGPIAMSDHENLEYKLVEIAEKIKSQGKKRRALAKILRRVKDELELPIDEENQEVTETKLVTRTGLDPLNDDTIAGVDGGVLARPLHGLDLILVRAIATIFHYEDESLKQAEYHPSEMPWPELMSIHEPLDSREFELLVGMYRQLTELKRAKEAIENWSIDTLLLDGSIVPQYTSHASKSRTRELYRELVDSFTNLYQTCVKKNVLLLGVVKDSRSARLIDIFQGKILSDIDAGTNLSSNEIASLEDNRSVLLDSRDTVFLDHLLDPGERSFVFRYADAPANLLRDIGDWRNQIHAFYVKTVPYDRPLRIEFVSTPENVSQTADGASSLIRALSAHHDACALPSVLIEADACARLAQEEISMIRDSITDRLEPSTLLDLRRERGPF